MLTADFEFDLPEALIAQRPVEPRDQSRLMVVRRRPATIEHRVFADLPELLAPGDILARNNTRVVPARLLGHRAKTGGKWEGLFLRARDDGDWEMLATTRGHPGPGERFVVGEGLALVLVAREAEGRWIVRPDPPRPAIDLLAEFGHVPLPPYIRKGRDDPEDRLRYQTVYADQPGSVAAPTAGLHFTDGLLARLADRGVDVADLTLHVGLGTFRPIAAERIEEHTLHEEWAELTPATADLLNQRRAAGGRVVAVGTTSSRVLETAARSGRIEPFRGPTALYLRPGHEFRGVDALITNFHLPRSSLLVLVAARLGLELTRRAYEEAIRQAYRFYSYGDAMLILEA